MILQEMKVLFWLVEHRLHCLKSLLNLYQGGESTRQEMCLSFLAYYPRTPMSACYSSPIIESPVHNHSSRLLLNSSLKST